MFDFWCMHVILILWNDSIFINIRYPKNEVPWKSWLDPRFSWNSMLKWILKWLPLDRGHFKLYFHKGKSMLVISRPTFFRTLEYVVLSQVVLCITMHFIPVKCLVFRYYWSTISRKRGGMKTLARSSVSLSPQVRVKFKLTASR